MDTMELHRALRAGQRDMGVAMTAGDVEGFLADMTARGRAPETVERYRRSLERLAEVLPEDGRIRRGTLDMCREALIEAGCISRLYGPPGVSGPGRAGRGGKARAGADAGRV